MIGPIKYLSRVLALRKWRSNIPHGITPLSKIKSVVVLIDANADDAVAVSRSIKQFFDYKSIPVFVLSAQKEHLNYAGYIRKKYRLIDGVRQEDLFISLVTSEEDFAMRFEALCSPACFKVGCCPLSEDVFDMLVGPAPGFNSTQSSRFSAIKEYLSKVV